MRNRILTISHSTKILKHPVDNVKQKKYFFTFAARSAAQTTLPSLPKLPATAIFPFPIRHPLAPFFAFPRFSVPAPISVPFPQNLSTTPLFPAFPFLSSFQVPFPKLIPNPVQSLSPSSSPLPLSQPRDIFIFFSFASFLFFLFADRTIS